MGDTATVDYTKTVQIRGYLCVICGNVGIYEIQTEQKPNTGENPANLPDQQNCDTAIFSSPETKGGKLLKIRPKGPWKPESELCGEGEEKIPLGVLHFNISLEPGGVCNNCIERSPTLRVLLPHITDSFENY